MSGDLVQHEDDRDDLTISYMLGFERGKDATATALTLAQARIRELETAVADEVDRLRPHYLSGTATDIARRQMLDHFAAKFPRARTLTQEQPNVGE